MKSIGAAARICLLATFVGCGEDGPRRDGRPGTDGGPDAAVDAGRDAATDAAVDAGGDAAADAGRDSAMDAAFDAAPNPSPHCADGMRNGDETGSDCGGSCGRCSTGEACVTPTDCQDEICAGGLCTSTFVVRGRVFDTSGIPVSSAEVHVQSGEHTITDVEGAFEFTVAGGNAIAFVSAPGYVASAVPIRGALGESTVQMIVSPVGATATFASGDPILFERGDGLRIEGPAGVFVDMHGQPVSGPVTLQLTPIDPNDPLAMRSMPVEFLADDGSGERAPIAPAALMDITVLSGSTKLNIAPGSGLVVDVPILAENPALEARGWSFNEAKGLWQPEGEAVRTIGDLGQAIYRSRITHLSAWYWGYSDGRSSFDLYHWECIDLTVTRNKIPLANAIVHLSPAYWSEWTDNNGRIAGAYLYHSDPIEVHAHTADYAYASASITLPARPASGCRKGGVLDITVPGAPSCPADSKWCSSSSACKNTSSDRNNCGTCDNACAAGLICRSGTCACETGRASCSGTCVDLKADRKNCGACGKTCLDWQECTAGDCVDKPCPSGLTRCGAHCVDVQADNDSHCGACNRSCAGNDYCRLGQCIVVPTCGDAQVESGEWTEICDDGTNDGSYGSCAPDCLAFAPHCGDAILQAGEGELCEDGSASPCPASCDDGDACTADLRTGSAAVCDVLCTNTPILLAAAGDGCCPAGANANTDPDCTPICDNSEVEPGEACDDGTNDGAYGGCMPDCSARAPFCGDGSVQPAYLETCDPLSGTPCPSKCDDADACTIDVQMGAPETCTIACARTTITEFADGDSCCPTGANALDDGDCPAVCGNGVIERTEACDDTVNDGSYDGCAVGCLQRGPYCGDGVTDVGVELCDGNCSAMATCLAPDPCTAVGLLGSAATCDLRCEMRLITAPTHDDICCPEGANATNDNDCDPVCSNGVLEPGEACDDDNNIDGDGCSADCGSDESCGNDVVDAAAGEVCDDGNTIDGDGCPAGCRDIDVCAMDNGGCSADADCVDMLDSRTCTCRAGYSGDGVTCTDIDECDLGTDSCDPIVSCTNTAGSYECGSCPSGYEAAGNRCEDIDECDLGTDSCDPIVSCTNTAGSYECGTCPSGYETAASGCEDIDECAVDNGGCSVACANVPGSFECGNFGPVATGSLFSCAIHQAGALFCWGNNRTSPMGTS